MSLNKRSAKVHKINYNYVDGDLHTSTHAKTAFYSAQNHSEFENKALPVNLNSLQFKDSVNKQLITTLYTDNDQGGRASSEFKSNLLYYFCYYTLSLISILGFVILLYCNSSISSSHFQIHLICIISLLVASFTLLILVQKYPLVLKSRLFFLLLSAFSNLYYILADERILCKVTGQSYSTTNQIPLIICISTQLPMLRLILFDSFIHSLILGLSTIGAFMLVHLIFPTYSKYSDLSEISLLSIFILIQIIETYRNDLRIKNIFWRREKEVVFHKESSFNFGVKSLGINSDVDVIMEICENLKNKIKEVNKVVMYKDVKKIMKEALVDIEKIKWKTAHKQDVKIIMDPDIDEEDKEYIQQNFLGVKSVYSDRIVRNFTEASEKIPNRSSARFSVSEVEGLLSAFSNNWNFDIWFIHDSLGQSVSIVGSYLLNKWSLYSLYNIGEETGSNFFENLEKAYKNNPYHNACHAADVMHSFLYFVLNSTLQSKISSLEILASIISILGHDVAHPGVTNRFLINNKDDLAIEYNDTSVLENMHCSTIYKILNKQGCNILENMSVDDWQNLRNLIIHMVISTDMAKHFDILGQFRARVISLKDLELSNLEDKKLVLSYGLKCADLGHSAKSTDLHKKWSFLVCDELFAQGDLEKERMLSVSMYCDRDTTDIDKSQSGFLKNICIPLYEVWGLYLNSPSVQENCINQQITNQKYWEDRGRLRKSTVRVSFMVDSNINSLYRNSSEIPLKT